MGLKEIPFVRVIAEGAVGWYNQKADDRLEAEQALIDASHQEINAREDEELAELINATLRDLESSAVERDPNPDA